MTAEQEGRPLCVGRHEKPKIATRPFLCADCRDRLYQRLDEIPNMAGRALLAHDGTQAKSSEGKVSGSSEDVLPGGIVLTLLGPSSTDRLSDAVRSDPKSMACQDPTVPIPDVLASWVRVICEERDLTTPKPTLKAVCTFLRRHCEWAADQPWADEFDTEIRECHARLQGAAGLANRGTRYRDAECPSCGAIGTLMRWDGQDTIRCHTAVGGCGETASGYYVTALRAHGDVA